MEIAAPVLSIVIPCYNEEEVLPETVSRLTELLQRDIANNKIASDSHILLVDDGSKDGTWHLISELGKENLHIKGLRLAHNRGHQFALLAGLENANGDAIVSIDADLQDDISVISTMIEAYKKGNDIVYGVRASRKTDTFFKRNTAQGYYWLLKKLGVDIVYNHADFRLMSRKTIEALKNYGEVNLFLRGIIPTLGFRTTQVTYTRSERFAGESKYPLKKMLALALEGVTSFSIAPLRLISGLGFAIFVISMMVSMWAVYTYLMTDDAIPGWTSSVLPMYLLGGVQLLSLGMIGEYVAKTYMETKRRPRYLIMTEVNSDHSGD